MDGRDRGRKKEEGKRWRGGTEEDERGGKVEVEEEKQDKLLQGLGGIFLLGVPMRLLSH